MDAASARILIIVFASALGAGYFLYGKREQRASFLLAGAALCSYPYFVSSLWATALLGAAFAAVPYFVND